MSVESVGSLLRHWRTKRRMSQLDLADQAEVSTRHLSCLENGKASPSREMVLVLASALEVPLRERNTLLRAAGYAAAYRETDLEAPEMAPVRDALAFLLEKSEPYGAVVVDRLWNVQMLNGPMRALATWFTGEEPALPANLLRLTFGELRPWIDNWEEVARDILHRLHRAALDDPELAELYEELASGVPSEWRRVDWTRAPSLLMPLVLVKDGVRLSFFTTVTTIGAPADITLAELQIETYFPADEATAQLVGGLR